MPNRPVRLLQSDRSLAVRGVRGVRTEQVEAKMQERERQTMEAFEQRQEYLRLEVPEGGNPVVI